MIKLELDDGINDATLNEIIFDEDREAGYDPGFNPSGYPFEILIRGNGDASLRIRVWSKDNGNIPHFHVERSGSNEDACVKIEEPEYFIHGRHNGHLDRKEVWAVNALLGRRYKDGRTNWQRVCDAWNAGSERAQKVKCQTMPNYVLLCGAE